MKIDKIKNIKLDHLIGEFDPAFQYNINYNKTLNILAYNPDCFIAEHIPSKKVFVINIESIYKQFEAESIKSFLQLNDYVDLHIKNATLRRSIKANKIDEKSMSANARIEDYLDEILLLNGYADDTDLILLNVNSDITTVSLDSINLITGEVSRTLEINSVEK